MTKKVQFKVSREHLRALLAAYGISDFTFRKLGNSGSGNLTFLVSTPTSRVVLRIYKYRGITYERISQEVDFVNFLARKRLPVAKIIPNADGEAISSRVIGGTTWRYIVMQYIPGEHVSSYTDELVRDMASIQARMHLSSLVYIPHASGVAQISNRSFTPRSFLLGGLKRFSPLAFAPKGVSHFDYSWDNILMEGGRVKGVIDFEGIRQDLLIICVYFSLAKMYDLHHDLRRVKGYVASYQKVRKLSAIEKVFLAGALALRFRDARMLRLYS